MRLSGLSTEHAMFATPSFAAVAESLGMAGMHASSVGDFATLAARLVDLRGPLLVDIPFNPNVMADWFREFARTRVG
jgi:thiamine pyrophosphate-dependent acetolactate synthase large subunit-like protein